MKNKEDINLTDQAQLLDTNTFSSIFNQHWEELFIYAFNILKDEDIAKDTVQEVFISIWNRRHQNKIRHLKPYLYKAVKFQITKTLRDNPKYENYHEVYATYLSCNNIEEVINAQELSICINNSISKLPFRCAKAFHLSRNEGLSNKEVAQELNISLSTVENHINKALKVIKKDLEEYCYLILFLFFKL